MSGEVARLPSIPSSQAYKLLQFHCTAAAVVAGCCCCCCCSVTGDTRLSPGGTAAPGEPTLGSYCSDAGTRKSQEEETG